MSECCNLPCNRSEGILFCTGCFNQIPDIEFESYLSGRDSSSTRYRKFTEVILAADLPWNIRETVLGMFSMIETYFCISDRTNFINLQQLASVLAKRVGGELYSDRFKVLKTKARVKAIENFVQEAFKYSLGEPVSIVGCHLIEDLEYLTPVSLYVSCDKSPSGHIYSDRNSINYALRKSSQSKAKKVQT